MNHWLAQILSDGQLLQRLYRGWRHYARTGETPDDAYQALITLHCRSNGLSTDLLASLMRRFRRPITLDAHSGVLGAMSDQRFADALETLERDGYVIFDTMLPKEICAELNRFAEITPAMPESDAGKVPGPILYDRTAPVSRRYIFAEQTAIEYPAIQRLVADESLLNFAQTYFGAAPFFDFLVMWWSTTFSDAPGSQAAQFFHFDFDRIKWLKVFFYLTDVTEDRGPHCFVKGSHRRGLPGAERLLEHGYARLTDEDVIDAFGREGIVSIAGKAGTIIAVDTRGFHKGIVPRTGDRLVLQFQYAISPFGGTVPKSHLGNKNIFDADLKNLITRHPSIFTRFLQGNGTGLGETLSS